jgi:hypothetical protein
MVNLKVLNKFLENMACGERDRILMSKIGSDWNLVAPRMHIKRSPTVLGNFIDADALHEIDR